MSLLGLVRRPSTDQPKPRPERGVFPVVLDLGGTGITPDHRDALAAAIDAERAAVEAAARAAEVAERARAEADRRGMALEGFADVPDRIVRWKADRLRDDGAGPAELPEAQLPADLAAARAQRDDAVRELGDSEGVLALLEAEATAATADAEQARAAVLRAADAVVKAAVLRALAEARALEVEAGRLRALASGYRATWNPTLPAPDPMIMQAIGEDLHRLLLDRSGLAHGAADAALQRFRRELSSDPQAVFKL